MIRKFFFKVHLMGSVPHENQGRGPCHGVKNHHLSVNAFMSWHQKWIMAKILEAGCPFWDPWESGLYQPPFLVFSNSDYVNYEQFLQRLSCGPTKSSIFMFFFHWTQDSLPGSISYKSHSHLKTWQGLGSNLNHLKRSIRIAVNWEVKIFTNATEMPGSCSPSPGRLINVGSALGAPSSLYHVRRIHVTWKDPHLS